MFKFSEKSFSTQNKLLFSNLFVYNTIYISLHSKELNSSLYRKLGLAVHGAWQVLPASLGV